MAQDFSRKLVVVVRDDVVSWQLTNTVAHIAAYLGNKMTEPFDTGDRFTSKDDLGYPRNSQFPIVTLRATEEEIRAIVLGLRNTNLLWIAYVQEMIDLIDDEELARAIHSVSSEEMNILGVGIFGTKEELQGFTGGLKLLR